MSIYKVWNIADIKKEINKLEQKSNFSLDGDVKIKINPRLRRTLAWCKYKYENELTKIESIEFSKYLVDGSVCEEEVLDTMIHEFAHAYTDYNKPEGKTLYTDGHTKEWRENTIKLGGSGEQYYKGNEFTYIKPENNTLKIRCKNCGKVYDICDMALGHEVLDHFKCTNRVENKSCNGKFEILADISTDEKRLKCIKQYIKRELTGNIHGELKTTRYGTKYRLLNIKSSSIVNLRISYRNNTLKIQVSNKLGKYMNVDDKKRYDILLKEIENYLNNKELFKFIHELKVEFKGGDRYDFSFPLDINNISLLEI